MLTISFILLAIITAVLAIATVVEPSAGTAFVVRHIYGSPAMLALWAAMAVSAVVAFIRGPRAARRIPVITLHASFILILTGALVTYLTAERGTIHLRTGRPTAEFTADDGSTRRLPFEIELTDFKIIRYPGTPAPMDFVSRIRVAGTDATVAMNRIYSRQHYRFYQSSYDTDGRGTILTVNRDPWGIAVSYSGYALLFISIVAFMCSRRTRFRRLLAGAAMIAPLIGSAAPRALPAETAAKFGELYVLHGDRIAPLSTLAKDFTVKITGSASYQGLTPEQVLTGWLFYYDSWRDEPCILIKDKKSRQALGIRGKYASLADFAGSSGYKLEGETHAAANEKFALVSRAAAGSLWRIYPYADSTGTVEWFSPVDRMPADMDEQVWNFIRHSVNYAAEQTAHGHFDLVDSVAVKTLRFQQREAGHVLPSPVRTCAERLYTRINDSRPVAGTMLLTGIVAWFMLMSESNRRTCRRLFTGLLATALLWILAVVALNAVASWRIPLSNGYETMQLTAAGAAAFAIRLSRRQPIVLSLGFITAGFALLVSMLGLGNPQVTLLMPVLHSPLLCIHVAIIMIAYALLALVTLGSVTWLFTRRPELAALNRALIYPAVFCLAAGIFTGAIWANISWGRYWGWDPKEVWALITMTVYSAPLHPGLRFLRSDRAFSIYTVAAFATVIMTYFGVNFLLGGLHSYA